MREVAGVHLRTALHGQRSLAAMVVAMPRAVVDVVVGVNHGAVSVLVILMPLAGVYAQVSGVPTLALALSHVVDELAGVLASVGVGHDAPAVSVAGYDVTFAEVAFLGIPPLGGGYEDAELGLL